jgi:hypothetical protein
VVVECDVECVVKNVVDVVDDDPDGPALVVTICEVVVECDVVVVSHGVVVEGDVVCRDDVDEVVDVP